MINERCICSWCPAGAERIVNCCTPPLQLVRVGHEVILAPKVDLAAKDEPGTSCPFHLRTASRVSRVHDAKGKRAHGHRLWKCYLARPKRAYLGIHPKSSFSARFLIVVEGILTNQAFSINRGF